MQSPTIIAGRLARDPEYRDLPGGKTVVEVTIAVNERRLGDEPRFVKVAQWEKAGEAAVRYLHQGRYVVAEGLLDARAYNDKDGNARVELVLKRAHIEFGPNPNGTRATDTDDQAPEPVTTGAGADDDIAF
jgi:single stranded DNA-binding protein